VFSTVGFGDITAKTEAARLVVTGQMITDLVVVGVGIRIILGAVTRGSSGETPAAYRQAKAPSRPIAVAFCTASWREETPSLR
jgi:hypothetical protein